MTGTVALTPLRVTADVGGTFTDVVVSDGGDDMTVGKAPTRKNAGEGVLAAIEDAAGQMDLELGELLSRSSIFIYSTTRSTNAILERDVAKTAFLTTQGFPDILVLREGGRKNGFDFRVPFPDPFISRDLTFEIPERMDSEGAIARELDEAAAIATLRHLDELGIESIAVCFLWSVVNGRHEQRMGELIRETLPDVTYTLSHELNPVAREYRRASAAAIDAALKPLMGPHFKEVEDRLRTAGFAGEFLVATSRGGVAHVDDASERPIDTVRSGPSMAPIAGLTYASAESLVRDVIVCDTGGTSFDVSLARDSALSYTRETWLGPEFTGDLTGTTSVDIRSIGSGGGSIAWIDSGGLLRVGPRSAGATPGPACYGRGGTEATVTDAAVVLGWIDPETFLGGRMKLDVAAAKRAVMGVADRLEADLEYTAEAVLSIANEHMVRAIQDITVKEGVDPRDALIVAGGGAAGIGIVPIVRELGSKDALVPRAGGALSATGAQFSEIAREFSASGYAHTGEFDFESVNGILDSLDSDVAQFKESLAARGVSSFVLERFVDARYQHQVWELEVPLPFPRFDSESQLEVLGRAFDDEHMKVFSVSQPGARVECLTWKVRLRAAIDSPVVGATTGTLASPLPRTAKTRDTYMAGTWHVTQIHQGDAVAPNARIEGPAIIEETTSTIVIPPGASARLSAANCYYLEV